MMAVKIKIHFGCEDFWKGVRFSSVYKAWEMVKEKKINWGRKYMNGCQKNSKRKQVLSKGLVQKKKTV